MIRLRLPHSTTGVVGKGTYPFNYKHTALYMNCNNCITEYGKEEWISLEWNGMKLLPPPPPINVTGIVQKITDDILQYNNMIILMGLCHARLNSTLNFPMDK